MQPLQKHPFQLPIDVLLRLVEARDATHHLAHRARSEACEGKGAARAAAARRIGI
jgi:hypothetical protein